MVLSFAHKYHAIDDRAFRSLENQVGIIQQKILALYKIKELEDALDDQKSLVAKNSKEISELNEGLI